MSSKTKIILFTLFFISLLFLSTVYAQPDYTRWGLPDGAIARLGKGGVNEIAYSPDGKLLAVATNTGIWLYDVETTQELALMDATAEVNTVAFSPDGKMLVSAHHGKIGLWDVATKTQIAIFDAHNQGVYTVSFSPNGSLFASGALDGIVYLWDLHSIINAQD